MCEELKVEDGEVEGGRGEGAGLLVVRRGAYGAA
jgi:hypothetical protein